MLLDYLDLRLETVKGAIFLSLGRLERKGEVAVKAG